MKIIITEAQYLLLLETLDENLDETLDEALSKSEKGRKAAESKKIAKANAIATKAGIEAGTIKPKQPKIGAKKAANIRKKKVIASQNTNIILNKAKESEIPPQPGKQQYDSLTEYINAQVTKALADPNSALSKLKQLGVDMKEALKNVPNNQKLKDIFGEFSKFFKAKYKEDIEEPDDEIPSEEPEIPGEESETGGTEEPEAEPEAEQPPQSIEDKVKSYNELLNKQVTNGNVVIFETPGINFTGTIQNKQENSLELKLVDSIGNGIKLLIVNTNDDNFIEHDEQRIIFESAEPNGKQFVIQVNNFYKKESEEKEEEEEVYGEDALQKLVSDETLRNAFYRQPSFWRVFVAEMKNKVARGKGIGPVLELMNGFVDKHVSQQPGFEAFTNGQAVSFYILKESTITYVDENQQTQNKKIPVTDTNQPLQGVVKGYSIQDSMTNKYTNAKTISSRSNTNPTINMDMRIAVRKKLEKDDVFNCDIILTFPDGTNRTSENIPIQFLNSNGYNKNKKTNTKK